MKINDKLLCKKELVFFEIKFVPNNYYNIINIIDGYIFVECFDKELIFESIPKHMFYIFDTFCTIYEMRQLKLQYL